MSLLFRFWGSVSFILPLCKVTITFNLKECKDCQRELWIFIIHFIIIVYYLTDNLFSGIGLRIIQLWALLLKETKFLIISDSVTERSLLKKTLKTTLVEDFVLPFSYQSFPRIGTIYRASCHRWLRQWYSGLLGRFCLLLLSLLYFLTYPMSLLFPFHS